jgi:hypothetical protein
MKSIKVKSLLFTLAASVALAAGAQEFVNLNFESATVQTNDPTFGWLDWNLAAPGWNHSSGSATAFIYYGLGHIGIDQIYFLMDSNSLSWMSGTQLAGNYSLAFASGYHTIAGTPISWVTAFISQTGSIPASSRSLWMLATGPFQVFLGGTEISMDAQGGNLYAGDISGLAGITTAELKIANAAPIGQVHDYAVVDDILFSPITVPEPSCVALWVFGAALVSGWRRNRLSGAAGR